MMLTLVAVAEIFRKSTHETMLLVTKDRRFFELRIFSKLASWL